MVLRRLGAFVALLVVVVGVTGSAAQVVPLGTPDGTGGPPVTTRAWFGVLELDERHAAAVADAGVRVTVLPVAWDRWEPGPGVVDEKYVRGVRDRHAALVAAGLDVVLDAGVQYPPRWVWSIPGAAMVDQHGRQWRSGIGADMPDVVHNRLVRAEVGEYVAELGHRLGDLEWTGVRIGGGPYNELRYPEPPGPARDSWWAYSASAQATSPVPGWRPGDPGTEEAGLFLDWYMTSLTDYLVWQVDAYRSAFGADVPLHVLQPSWGVRAGERDDAVAGRLVGRTRGEARQTLQQGLDWAGQVRALRRTETTWPNSTTVLWSTWLDARSQGDDISYEAPVEHLARLADPDRAVCRPLQVGGENTGRGSLADMQYSVDQVRRLGLAGMLWMREPDMYGSAHATLTDYGRLMRTTWSTWHPAAPS